MAPEQAHGAAPEPQQDLYPVGVVGIQLLTGLSPRNQVAAPTGRYGEFLAALTHADPEQRPRTASIAQHLPRQLGVPPGPTPAPAPSPPESLSQPPNVTDPHTRHDVVTVKHRQ